MNHLSKSTGKKTEMQCRPPLSTQAKRARWSAAGIAGLLAFAAMAATSAPAIEKLPDDKLYSFIANDPVPAGTIKLLVGH